MSHCTPPDPARCGYCEEEIIAQLPKWTVLYNIVSLESDRFVGTGWEFFDAEEDASDCYQRHIDVGNCPTKRPFHRKCAPIVSHTNPANGLLTEQHLLPNRLRIGQTSLFSITMPLKPCGSSMTSGWEKAERIVYTSSTRRRLHRRNSTTGDSCRAIQP